MKGFLDQLTGIIEANLTNDQFGVSELAREMHMSRSSLHRKVKDAAGITVSQFICRVRLRKASELITKESSTVAETAFECGFHSVTYFTKCFRDFYGTSPGQFKRDEAYKTSENANQTGIKKRWGQPSKMIRVAVGMLILISIVALLYVSVFHSTEKIPRYTSIGIYPFQYIGYESDRQYLADGMREAVLHHLSKIEDLRVISCYSMEDDPGIKEDATAIGRKVHTTYLLDGSYQEADGSIHLHLRLTNTSDGKQIWSNEYLYQQSEVFSLQSEIAQKVAGELDAAITPAEKERIETAPTFSLTAYDFYLRGQEEFRNHQMNNDNQKALLHAEHYFREALRYDPDFARAYAGLAMVYKNRNRGSAYFADHFLDSMLVLADRALACDKHTDAAYSVKGLYYWYLGHEQKALEMYNQALRLNPNSWEAYRGKGTLFLMRDPLQSIQNYLQAASLVDGANLKMILKEMLYPYLWAGCIEEAKKCNWEAFRLFGDSLIYYAGLGAIESQQGDFEQAAEYYEQAYEIDSTYHSVIWYYHDITRQLMFNHMMAGHPKASLEYFTRWLEKVERPEEIHYNIIHRVGYVCWKNGLADQAEDYFNLQMRYCNRLIDSKKIWGEQYFAHYDRAAIYAFRKDKDKAYHDLEIVRQIQQPPLWLVTLIEKDPMFESIRNEEPFQQIVKEIKNAFRKEHDRIALKLQQTGSLQER